MRPFLKKSQSVTKIYFRLISTTHKCQSFQPMYIDWKKNTVYGGDLPVPTPDRSVGSVLFGRMMRYDRRYELLQICADSPRELTTKEFLESTVALAQKLAEEGTKKGDFVLLVGGNTINMNIALMGVLFLAAVPVPLSNKTELDEFEIILNTIKPAFFGCERKYLYPFRRVLLQSTDLDPSKIFLLEQETDPREPDISGFQDFIKGRGHNFESFKPAEVDDTKAEVALGMKALTDGSSGRIVGITHHNLNSVIARYDALDDGINHRNKVILMVQKVLWMASGIYSLVISCAFGSKLVVMREFTEENFLKAVDKYKVTSTYMFGSKWWMIYKYTPKGHYDLTSCIHAYATDGSLPLALTDGLKEKIGITMLPCYGITELTGLVLKQAGKQTKEGCVGKLVPQVYGKVVSDRSQNVGPNIRGELCFKGPVISLGYINNQRATRNLFDKEGYLTTGQYGYYDESGDFFIIDKIIDQIRYKDYKISPRELEGIIKSLESVKDVCVSGIAHPLDGEYPIAFVVLQKGQKLTDDDIMQYVNAKVPDYKRLRGGVVFLKKIPRFRDTGSIMRKLFKTVLSKYRMKLTVDVASKSSKN